MKTWHGLCHLPSSPSPSSICHGPLRSSRVCTHTPPPPSPSSFLTLHLGAACTSFSAPSSALTYWFLYPCLPVKGSVVIYVFQPLSFDVSLPPNERQSVSESSEISVMLPEWQRLADRLYLLSCYLYVVLILIGFESYYIQYKENITMKSALPLSLSKHVVCSGFVDACIYILGCVSVWLLHHS